MDVASFDPFDSATIESPFAFYRALRDQAPLYRVPGADFYYLTRWDDVRAAVMDPETFGSNITGIVLSAGKKKRSVLGSRKLPFGPVDVLAIQDPPLHRPQRKISLRGIDRNVINDLEPMIRAYSQELMEPLVGTQVIDWMNAYAFRVPMRIAVELLALPPEDCARLKTWSDDAIALLSGVNTAPSYARLLVRGIRLYRYCARVVAELNADTRSPMMRSFATAIQEGELSRNEVASMVMQILIAGSDSSASTMGSAVWMLARNPSLQEQVRRDPSLIPNLIEEVLRLESPFQGHFRVLRKPTELHGVSLDAGARLMLMWASANRDERHFEDADEIRLDREIPRGHYGFGHGIHLCIGAPLARLEVQIMLEELLACTSRIELAAESVCHRRSVFVRTLESLPLRLYPA